MEDYGQYESVNVAGYCRACNCYVFDAWGDHTDGNPNHKDGK